jgi:hypothetical protein
MNQKIVIVFEGQYHLEQLPRILERNGRDYPFAGNFENNEEMYRYILDRIDKGADVIVTAGGYYDYLYERLDRPVIKVRRSFATIALVTKRAREKSDKVGFLARQGILFESALKYKEEFNDPIVLEEFKDDEELYMRCLSEEYGCQLVSMNIYRDGGWTEPQYFDL